MQFLHGDQAAVSSLCLAALESTVGSIVWHDLYRIGWR
jgi:hypothetical protein